MSPTLGQPARPDALPARPESQQVRPEAWPPVLASGMDVWASQNIMLIQVNSRKFVTCATIGWINLVFV